MYEHLYDSSVVKSMKPTSVYDPDGTREWYRKIERIHRENREKNTVADVIIDPENTVLKGDNVTRQKLLNLLEKYSCVFEATIGHVVDSEFEVHAKIDAAKSDRSPKSAPMGYGKNLPESIQKGIEDTLDKEAAEGVLRFLPKGVTAKNCVSFFGVGKRDAETAKIEMSPTNVRIVVDCSKQINGATQHCAKQMDSIQRILQLAAPHTKHGFIAQVDISSMFHCFALAKELWPHFVVNHPKNGEMCYTRLPMGWISSPAAARELVTRILYDHLPYTSVYMDDMFISANSKEQLLDRLEKVLATLKYRNLRLKGKKCLIFAKDVVLLGRRVKDGKILMNRHILQKAIDATPENITTVKLLKRYLGVINYLAISLPRRTEVLWELNKEVSGSRKLAERIEWTPELTAAYKKVAHAINTQIVDLFQIEKDLETYLVVDSSNLGSGAYLYQLNKGKTQIVRLWSKKRGDDGQNAQWSSCQLELHGILNAVLNFAWEIDYISKPLTVITDSASVQKLFERARQGKSLSQDRRINEMIVKLLAFDLTVIYEKGESTQIHLADFISRSPTLLTDCSKECTVCKLAYENQIPKASPLDAENLDLVTKIEEPAVSFEVFEEIYNIKDEQAFKLEVAKTKLNIYVTPKTREEEISMAVLRSASKQLARKIKNNDQQNSAYFSGLTQSGEYKLSE
ncbi:unnamed protein product [Oikopleura dioica]|uniref:ribonuclease H n=1 Tax=Oikopleura dioica TaxID=34765 RepID=E4YVI6_OIKDI|nr:unnamed protein product [Oikopleura dioica]